LNTGDDTPTLTGTLDPDATFLRITVNGIEYTLGLSGQVSRNGGTWILDGTQPLPNGTYEVLVHTRDAAGNVREDATTNELTVNVIPHGDLTAIAKGKKLTLTSPAPGLTYDFEIQFTANGVTLVGHNGTT